MRARMYRPTQQVDLKKAKNKWLLVNSLAKWTIRGQPNRGLVNMRTGQLVDHALDNSRTGYSYNFSIATIALITPNNHRARFTLLVTYR